MLIVTRKIVEALVIPSLKVSLTVQNTEGRRVRLAVSAPPEIPVVREEGSSRTDRHRQPEMRMEGVRVLLADADASLIERYETHLSSLGFVVITAGNGIECLARLRERMPHLVVLDAGLLWGRTEGVLAVMNERADVPDAPVLVIYDRACESARDAVLPFGTRDFAAKPLTPRQLAARICKLLAFPIDGGERQS